MGLRLPSKEIFNERDGGLMRAAVGFGGCTAVFISADGLLATNYHCALGTIQAASSVKHDYLKRGVLALERSAELPATGPRSSVTVLRSSTDVSAAIKSAAAGAEDDRARYRAIAKAKRKLVAACEAEPGMRCRVAAFYGNSSYRLFRSLQLRDLRIVFAPPASVGDFGGEIDNWMWPRHTGDFALLRAYIGPDGKPAPRHADNVPYRPSHHLRVSPQGVAPGDFVAVMGYPGRTTRYLPAVEVRRNIEQVLPSQVGLYGRWLDLLSAQAKRSPQLALKVAALKKGVGNRHKNARGMLAGIARMKLLDRVVERDQKLAQWAATPDQKRYRGVLGDMAKLSKRRRAAFGRRFVLKAMMRGSMLLALAVDLQRNARDAKLPDLERQPTYMKRSQRKLWATQKRRLRDFDRELESKLLATLAEFAKTLDPPIAALAALSKTAGQNGLTLTEQLAEMLDASSALNDLHTAKRLLEQADSAALEALDLPLLNLASALATELERSNREREQIEGAAATLEPAYFAMLEAQHHGPMYPDANGTPRFSYATVQGYSPRDGLWATTQTTLSGQLAKHSGAPPFVLPAKLRQAASAASSSYWVDPLLGDVPVCFLSNADTTGGNSGSPVVDGQGRLVGLNFDRVWENIAGDFGYNPKLSRNISVDVRYLLWMLDRVYDAKPLLDELGVGAYRQAAARSKHDRAPRPPARNAVGCALSGLEAAPSCRLCWLLFALGLWVRRHATSPPRSAAQKG